MKNLSYIILVALIVFEIYFLKELAKDRYPVWEMHYRLCSVITGIGLVIHYGLMRIAEAIENQGQELIEIDEE